MNCPVDNTPLAKLPHGATFYHACEQCHGIWLERMILGGVSQKFASSVPSFADQMPDGVSRPEPLACPSCQNQMAHRLRAGVQVDTCPDCKALWLDGYEILHLASESKKGFRRTRTTSVGSPYDPPPGATGGIGFSDIPADAVEGILLLARSFFE